MPDAAPASYFAQELAAALAAAPPPGSRAEANLWSHIVLGARLEDSLVTEIRGPTPPHSLLPYPGGATCLDDSEAERIKILGRVGHHIATIDLLANAPDTHLLLSLAPRIVRRSLPVYCPWSPDVLVEFADLRTLEQFAPLLSAQGRAMAPSCKRHVVHVSDMLYAGGENVNVDGLRALALLCLTPTQQLDLVFHGRRVTSEDEWSLWMGLCARLLTPLANHLSEGTVSVVGLERLFPARTVHLMTEADEEAETEEGILVAEVRERAGAMGIEVGDGGWARLRFVSASEWLEETGIGDEEADLWFARPQYVQPLAEELCLQNLGSMAQDE